MDSSSTTKDFFSPIYSVKKMSAILSQNIDKNNSNIDSKRKVYTKERSSARTIASRKETIDLREYS